jgi:bifunctional non-homologous end joining protein LigD
VADPDWLPASGDEAEVAVGGRSLRLTSLGRVLYPAAGFTKRDLIAYYAGVADVLLPHIAGRPLTLGRWPTGVDARGFAQMECRGAPDWMKMRPLQLRTGEIRNYCVIDDLPSLVWAANQSTIELHPYYGSGADDNEALQAIFDLDPRPGASVLDAAAAALRLRELLGKRGHDPVVKTSGGDGLHVFAPLAAPESFARVRAFCDEVAEELAAPAVNVDCAQNHPRRSLAAPYSLRAADVPVVSAPLRWDEVERAVAKQMVGGLLITAAQMPARIAELGDLFASLLPGSAAATGAV